MPRTANWTGFVSHEKSSSAIQLFDILQELPSMIEYADAIQSSQPGIEDEEVTNHLLALTSRAQSFELRISAWHAQLEQHHRATTNPSNPSGARLFWHEPSTLYNRLPPFHPGRIFPTFLCFPDMSIAEQLVLSWTALLYIPRLLSYTTNRLLQAYELPPLDPTNPFPTIKANSHHLACLIAQSLEYFLHPDVGLLEINFVRLPMNLSLAACVQLQFDEVAFFPVIRARLREMDTGFGDFLDAMMSKGGGMEAVRLLVND